MRRIRIAFVPPVLLSALALGLACATQGSVDERLQEAYVIGDNELVGDLLVSALDARNEAPRQIALLDRLAHLREDEERYQEAEEFYIEALRISRREYGEDPNTADRINNLGALVHKRGRYGEAETHYRLAMKIYDEALEPNHLRATTTMANLSMLDRLLERDEEALDLAVRALEIRERELDEKDPDVAVVLNLMGLVTTDSDAARVYLERSLAIRSEVLGEDHPDTAGTLNDLGVLALRTGRLEDAERHLDAARAIRELVLGMEHSRTAATWRDLAIVYTKQWRYSQAQPLLESAVVVQEQVLGPEHPEVGGTLQALGELYISRQRFAEAETPLRRALPIAADTYGVRHPAVATVLAHLGIALAGTGRLDEAAGYYERAIEAYSEGGEGNSQDVARLLENLGSIRLRAGETAEAQALFSRALEIQEEALGDDHSDLATSLLVMARMHADAGDLTRAEAEATRALRLAQSGLGESHPMTAEALAVLAEVYVKQGSLSKAEPLLQRWLALRQKNLGAAHPDLVWGLTVLGEQAMVSKRPAEAADLAEQAVAILDAVPEPDPKTLAAVLLLAGSAENQQGHSREALAYYERALSLGDAAVAPAARASTHLQMAAAHESLGELGAANRELGEALTLLRTQYGEDDARVGRVLFRQAQIAGRQGRTADAEGLYHQVVYSYRSSGSSADPELALARANLAASRAAAGDLAGASQLFGEAVPALHARLGAGDRRVVRAAGTWAALHDQMGRSEHAEGRPSEAVAHYRHSVEIREEFGDPRDPQLAVTLHSLGVLNHTSQNFADAEVAYLRALELVDRQDARAGRLLHDLGLVYATQGDFERAEPAFRESVAILEQSLPPNDPVVLRAREDLSQVTRVLAEINAASAPASPAP